MRYSAVVYASLRVCVRAIFPNDCYRMLHTTPSFIILPSTGLNDSGSITRPPTPNHASITRHFSRAITHHLVTLVIERGQRGIKRERSAACLHWLQMRWWWQMPPPPRQSLSKSCSYTQPQTPTPDPRNTSDVHRVDHWDDCGEPGGGSGVLVRLQTAGALQACCAGMRGGRGAEDGGGAGPPRRER